MTLREKAISTAYTAISFCSPEELFVFYQYAEELMGYPLFACDLSEKELLSELHERSKDDFKKMCSGDVEE